MNSFARAAGAIVVVCALGAVAAGGAAILHGARGAGGSVDGPASEPMSAETLDARFEIYAGSRSDEISLPGLEAVCGPAGALTADNGRAVISEGAPGELAIYTAGRNAASIVRISAPADARVFIRDEWNEQIYADGETGWTVEAFTLDARGRPTPVDAPERAPAAIGCIDKYEGARTANAVLAERGMAIDPMRMMLRRFFDPARDGLAADDTGLLAACTGAETLAALPPGEFLLDTGLDGETLSVTLVEVGAERGGFANWVRYSMPVLGDYVLRVNEASIAPSFGEPRIESRFDGLNGDGSGYHGDDGDTLRSIEIPCADPDAGRDAFSALRARARG